MKINSLSIYNLRSIKKLEDTYLSEGFDVFIGQNDAGKSTVLCALDIFFNIEKSFQFENESNQKNDLSFHSDRHIINGGFVEKDEISVICKFQLDGTDLKQERSDLIAHANGGFITVLKKSCSEDRFEGATKKTKKSSTYFILKKVFTNSDFNDLNGKKEEDLIALMEKYPDSKALLENLNKVGKPENIERIKALLLFAETNEQSTSEFVPANFPAKGSPDEIWPEFSLIDTKTSLDGKHKIIEDAFKKIDSKIEKQFKASLDKMKDDTRIEYDKITKKIKDYAQKNYIPQIEEFVARPTVKLSIARDLVMKKVGQKELSHFDLQGDGTKRRMMVAILQTSASIVSELESETVIPEVVSTGEEVAEYVPLKIWAFDEPELHLHPGAQRDLFNSLNKFKTEGFQIICSTHSTVFVNNANLHSVHLVSLNSTFESGCETKSADIEEVIKKSLGVKNSDIFFANLFVVVEGATEQMALPIIFEKEYGVTLASCGVTLIDGGGATKTKERVDFLVSSLGNAICLYDSDVKTLMGDELLDYETSGIVSYVGLADYEDAFDNTVWMALLNESYQFVDATGTSIWSNAILDTLRGSITQVDANKKFHELVKRYYQKMYLDLYPGDFNYPIIYEKDLMGKRLAEIAVEKKLVPAQLTSFIANIKARVS